MDAVYLKRHPIARPKKKAQAENRLRLSRHAKVLLGGHNNHGVARFAISARFALGTVVTGGTRGARRTGGAGRARGARGTVIAARTRGAGSTGGAWNTHRGAGSAGGTRGTRRPAGPGTTTTGAATGGVTTVFSQAARPKVAIRAASSSEFFMETL